MAEDRDFNDLPELIQCLETLKNTMYAIALENKMEWVSE